VCKSNVISKFLHLSYDSLTGIRQKLWEIWSECLMDVKNVCNWVHKFREDKNNVKMGYVNQDGEVVILTATLLVFR
jgi:hypothetical protein